MMDIIEFFLHKNNYFKFFLPRFVNKFKIKSVL